MSRKKDFPQGCSRTSHEDYEVVHLPWSKTQPLTDGEDLVKISAMPDWVQPAFNGLDQLNMMQSQAYQTALFTFKNILLCAPAAAGKTNVAILTILHHVSHHSHYKIVYLAPTKAMVSEVVRTLSTRLHHYRVNVKEHSSDKTLSPQQMEVTQIVISTPEMWDSLSSYIHLVRLVIIDGVHLHIKRRLVLQRIVERTADEKIQDVRLVGLSLPIPNFKEMGSFLNVDFEMGLFYFDSSFRGGPLDQWCIGIKGENPWPLMNHICYEKVFMAVARNHQVLIFVCSKMETAQTASAIREIAIARGTVGCFLKEESSSRIMEILNNEAGTVKSWFLKDLLPHGFGIYHGEMAREERDLVVELFINGKIQVLVSTTGLAWGVNLPAHLVIIKGTQIYGEELDPVIVMEMLGRAGRPQFDSCGEGIVMTSYHNLADYVWLMKESQ